MREVTAYTWVPDFAQGFVKDLRVRWALEEAGLPYTERLIDHQQKLMPEHLARQPFAQVPVYRDEQVELFVHHHGRGVEVAEVRPPRRGVARLLGQLALRALLERLVRLAGAGGHLPQRLADDPALVPQQHHGVGVEHGQDHDRAGVEDAVAADGGAVGGGEGRHSAVKRMRIAYCVFSEAKRP